MEFASGVLHAEAPVDASLSLVALQFQGADLPAEVGWTTIKLKGREFPSPVVFAEEGEPRLLDMVALGHALLAVDPVHHRVVRVNAKALMRRLVASTLERWRPCS